ncbi:SET domain-containing protein [Xylariaceae sp. FL1272]|nr:SET domain-containing protein [Xylariaceae sp. FL1272]
MRLYIYLQLSLKTLLFFVAATAARTTQTRPGICPWSQTERLLYPACASPQLLQELIAPELLVTPNHPSQSEWTGPDSCVNGTCVFSHSSQNGGLSLITSPMHAHVIQGYSVIPDGGVKPTPFREANILGKGIGLRANRTIKKGEVLLTRGPTLVAQVDGLVALEEGTRDLLYDISMQKLPRHRRDAFMAQMGDGVHGKIETNCFQMFVHGAGDRGTSHLGCYPEMARMNHDCRPNIHYRLSNMTLTAIAARDIEPDEELSVSYVDVFLHSKERKERIRRWGFECVCSLCTSSKDETETSDARLGRIAQLQADLNNFEQLKVTANTGAEYVALVEEEGLHAHLGSVYTRAALNFALFGDEARAQEYAQKAVKALSLELGPESGDVKAMRGLADDPKTHWTWGKRRRGL